MCIALPCRVEAVADPIQRLVTIRDGEGTPETVSAALLADSETALAALVGAFVLVHAGFAIAVVDEAEARSRLQVFAAMRGEDTALDLGDFYEGTR